MAILKVYPFVLRYCRLAEVSYNQSKKIGQEVANLIYCNA